MRLSYNIILPIIIVLFLIIIFTYKYKIYRKIPITNLCTPILTNKQFDESPVINILTRTGTRDTCFNILKKSILSQSYKNINHIISNDYEKNLYLKSNDNVYHIKRLNKKYVGHCPYNLYLNVLKSKVIDGWIIILDDDARLIDNKFIENLAGILKNCDTNDIIVYDIYIGLNKVKIPKIINNNVFHSLIDMACFAIHSSCNVMFDELCGGDFNFLENAHKENYNLKYINLKIGIWANYNGNAYGNINKLCSI